MPDGYGRSQNAARSWLLHSKLLNKTIKNDLQMAIAMQLGMEAKALYGL